MPITRIKPGLIHRDGFASNAGWTAGANFSFANTAPAYLTFNPTPPVFEYTAGALADDGGGVREFHLYVEAGVWWLFYGAGTGNGGAWRIQLAKSLDRGLSWEKLGPLNIQLLTGTGGSHAARDMLYMEKRGSTYYLHAMSAGGTTAGGVPSTPYQSQMWTNTALGATGWAYQNSIVATGALGNGTDTNDEYSGCVVKDGSTYHLFTSTRTGTSYGTGHFTSSGPNGPWTPHATVPNPVTMAAGFGGENPKVFWSPALNKWVMLITTFVYPAGNNFSQSMVTSADLVTWTPSSVPGLVLQAQSEIHGTTLGANILSPMYVPDGLVSIDAESFVPCTYDTQPSGILDVINSGRQGRFVVAEAAASHLGYTPPAGGATVLSDNFNSYTASSAMNGQGGWVAAVSTGITATGTQCNLGSAAGDKSIVHSAMTSLMNGSVSFTATLGATCGAGVILRYGSNTDFVLVEVSSAAGKAQIIGYTGGTNYTAMGASIQGPTNSWVADSTHDVRIDFAEQSFSVFVDNTLIGTLVTATTPSAGKVGLRNGQGGTGNRLVDNFVVQDAPATETAYRDITHTDFSAEFAIEFPATLVGAIGFDYHVTDANNLMRLRLAAGGRLTLQRIAAGTITSLLRHKGSFNTFAKRVHYIRIRVQDGRVRAWMDDELQVDYRDGTFSSGTKMGFCVSSATVRFRGFHVRTSDLVVVSGVASGHAIVPRTPGGLPLGKFIAGSDGIVEFASNHYPLAIISDDGTDAAPSDGGLIWGGDHLRISNGVARTVALTLTTNGTTPRASATGISWAFFEQAPGALDAPVSKGTGATTNASGVFSVAVTTALSIGATGYLVVTNSDGSIGQSPAAWKWAGPVLVSA